MDRAAVGTDGDCNEVTVGVAPAILRDLVLLFGIETIVNSEAEYAKTVLVARTLERCQQQIIVAFILRRQLTSLVTHNGVIAVKSVIEKQMGLSTRLAFDADTLIAGIFATNPIDNLGVSTKGAEE